jgi:hypothetical protein
MWPDFDPITASLPVFTAVGGEDESKSHVVPVYSSPGVNQVMETLSRAASNERESDWERRGLDDSSYFPSIYFFSGLFSEIFLNEAYFLAPTQQSLRAIDCGEHWRLALYIKLRAPHAARTVF